MADLMQGLLESFNNPSMGLAAGLLRGAAPGGTLGGGMMQGMMLMQQMQQNQARTDIANRTLTMQLEEQMWKRRQREQEAQQQANIAQTFGLPAGVQPTPRQLEAYTAGFQRGTPEYSKFMERQPLVQLGAQLERPEMGEAKGVAQAEVSLANLDELEQLIQSDPKILMSPTEAGIASLENMPIVGDVIQGAGLGMNQNEAKMYSLANAISNQVLAAMRGAQVGPAEQERFERQLPVPGQSPQVFMQNLRQTRKNLADLNRRQIEMRRLDVGQPTPTPETVQQPPAWATEENRID